MTHRIIIFPPMLIMSIKWWILQLSWLKFCMYISSPKSEIQAPSYCIFLDLKHLCSIYWRVKIKKLHITLYSQSSNYSFLGTNIHLNTCCRGNYCNWPQTHKLHEFLRKAFFHQKITEVEQFLDMVVCQWIHIFIMSGCIKQVSSGLYIKHSRKYITRNDIPHLTKKNPDQAKLLNKLQEIITHSRKIVKYFK